MSIFTRAVRFVLGSRQNTPDEEPSPNASIIASSNEKVFMRLEDPVIDAGDEFEVSKYRVVSQDR